MDDKLNDEDVSNLIYISSSQALKFIENVAVTCPVVSGALDSFKNVELQEKAVELVIELISLIPRNKA